MNTADHIKKADAHMRKASDTIFQLATGTLVMSITFKSTIRSTASEHPWLLSWSWLLLGICILAHIRIQLYPPMQELVRAQETAKLKFLEAGGSADDAEKKFSILDSRIVNLGESSTYKVFLVSFVCGILCMLAFALINND